MKSRKYLLTYCYENTDRTIGIGSITITQNQYYPSNQEVLDDAIKLVRRDICLPDSLKIVPLAFIRFEEEEGD